MVSIAKRLARSPPACPPRPSATARTPLVGPIGQIAATSSFGVSFCGERVLKTAAVPPRKSIDATSESWASINRAPSEVPRLRHALTTTAPVAIESRDSVAPVLICDSTEGWEICYSRLSVGLGQHGKLVGVTLAIAGYQIMPRFPANLRNP